MAPCCIFSLLESLMISSKIWWEGHFISCHACNGTVRIRVNSSTCEFKFAHQCEGIYEYLRQKAEYCAPMFNVRVGYNPLKQAATG
eukprot:scaffold27227_cov45-Attheya_sp.AAC.1